MTGADPVILRLGAVTREDIARVPADRSRIAAADDNAPASPGMLARHYAPAARLRLDAHDVRAGEALLAFGPDVPAPRRPHDQPQPAPAISPRPPPTCSPPCARSTPRAPPPLP